MSETTGSVISTTKSEAGTLSAFAGLNFAGDRLDPTRITQVLGVEPTISYRKGEVYLRSRGREARGRTGLWRLSTDKLINSHDLNQHLTHLLDIMFPGGSTKFVEPLRALIREYDLEADIDCFWYGEHGATPPEIPEETRAAFAKIGATIETDFQTD
jgi:hypothetical protein